MAPVHVTFATADGAVATVDGPVSYSAGDALVMGIEGKRWAIARTTFAESYEPMAPIRNGQPGRYRRRASIVWAKPMSDALQVPLDRDRGTLVGQPGDWLVQYALSCFGVVNARVFAETYELLD